MPNKSEMTILVMDARGQIGQKAFDVKEEILIKQ
ncbi:MAG: hypothetical protein ACI9XJ_001097 [Marivirga sp.]|jgi:hypothetical protein